MRRRSDGQVGLGEVGHFAAEHRDQAARRLQRQEEQADQRRLAGAGRAGQELERLRRDVEGQVAQHFRPHAVAQADVFEADQGVVRCPAGCVAQSRKVPFNALLTINTRSRRPRAANARENLVSNPLTKSS